MTSQPKQPREPRRRRARVGHVNEAGKIEHTDREVLVTGAEAEAGSLLARLAPVYGQHVKFYAKEYAGAPDADPEGRARACLEYTREEVAAGQVPPKEVSWRHLAAVADGDLAAALELWEGVKQKAREELALGTRTLEAIAPDASATPFDRARHIALREELADGWQPRNGIEHSLVDMLAVTYSLWLHWTEISHGWASGFVRDIDSKDRRYGLSWRPPSLDTAEAVDRAHRIADGYNRQFLRTLRQLRDLRRYAPPVIVNNGGQVNVAKEQINVTTIGIDS